MENANQKEAVQNFEQQFEHTKKQIQDFADAITTIKGLHEVILSTKIPDPKAEQTVAALISQMKLQNKVIRGNFEVFEEHLKTHKSSSGENEDYLQIKRQYEALLDNYFVVTKMYREEQEDFRDKCKNELKNHLNDPELTFTEDEIQAMIEEGNFSKYMRNYAAATEHHEKFLEEAQTRHRKILKLQESIDELRGLMSEYEAIADDATAEKIGEVEATIEEASFVAKEVAEQFRNDG